MRVAYVSQYDAKDVTKHSGLVYHIAQSLQNCDLSLNCIGPLTVKNASLFKVKKYLYSHLLKKGYLLNREPFILKHYARQAASNLSHINPDVVFSPGTVAIAYLECVQPVAFWTDATFAGVVDFYPNFCNLPQKTIEDGHRSEQLALEKCRLAIYSSEWAAKTALENYQIEASKVKVVAFGANIECNRNLDDIKSIINSRPANKCKLLFLGVDWFRKGGNIALEVAKQLNKQGLVTELTVVGCQPPLNTPLPDFVKSLGYISKSSKQGLQIINTLIADSHFLILPSLADCTPVVFCEANSFGVPCLSTNVGGIPTIIKDDVNGKTFSKEVSFTDYCTYISNLFLDYSDYKNLALASYNEYQARLNWSVAGQTVKKLLMELV